MIKIRRSQDKGTEKSRRVKNVFLGNCSACLMMNGWVGLDGVPPAVQRSFKGHIQSHIPPF